MKHAFDHPESLEAMLSRQRKASHPVKSLPTPPQRGPGYLGVAVPVKLSPARMTPMMRARVEEMHVQYTWRPLA